MNPLLAELLRKDEEQRKAQIEANRIGPTSGMTNPYQPQDFSGQESQIAQMRSMANSLRGQPAPEGRTVGPLNVYVRPDGAKAMQYGFNQLASYMADNEANALGKTLEAQRSKDMQGQFDYQNTLQEQNRGDKLWYQGATLQNQRDQIDSADKRAKDEATRRAEEARLKRENDLAVARIKVDAERDNAKLKDYYPGVKERTKFIETPTARAAEQEIHMGYKPEYANPEAARIADAVSKGLLTYKQAYAENPDIAESVAYWMNKQKHDSVIRHELYGGNLTKMEAQLHELANYSARTSPEVAGQYIAMREKIGQRHIETQAAQALKTNVPVHLVDTYYGGLLDVEKLAREVKSGEYDDRRKEQIAEAEEWRKDLFSDMASGPTDATAVLGGLTLKELEEEERRLKQQLGIE